MPIGDRVMAVTAIQEGHGSFAEECLVLAASAFAVPEGLADVEAAGFWIPHLTGWIGLVDRGRLAVASGSPYSGRPAGAASPPCSSGGCSGPG